MTKRKSKKKAGRYKIWMRPAVHEARKQLPGHVRQRIKRTIDSLVDMPRPAHSQVLQLPGEAESELETGWEVRRIRLDDWRIVYAINENWAEVAILTIQKRPPYNYEDLEILLSEL